MSYLIRYLKAACRCSFVTLLFHQFPQFRFHLFGGDELFVLFRLRYLQRCDVSAIVVTETTLSPSLKISSYCYPLRPFHQVFRILIYHSGTLLPSFSHCHSSASC